MMKRSLSFIFLFLLSCTQESGVSDMNKTVQNIKINPTDIKKLASKKIYFGHMSVGYNIIDGLKAIVPSDSGLNIMETSNPKDLLKPVFAHSKNGENTKPDTKIAAFGQKMDSGLGNNVDIAFFKFCYVDVTAETDINKLFNEYKIAMDGLIKKYPKTKFIHFTVPVTMEDLLVKRRLKDFVKKMLGKKVTDHVADNIKRMEFNNLLRKEYGSRVFDLAEIESTNITNEITFSNKAKPPHHFLQNDYTDDDGHLNKHGAKKVAMCFINKIYSTLYP